jgi:hypothetical protein
MRQIRFRIAAAFAMTALLAGCGDARLDKLSLGISRDSVAKLMGEPPHRVAPYLMGGKQWEVQLYARSSATEKDSIEWRKMSPVVFIDGNTVGWGWPWWGDASVKNGVTMPK